MIAYQTQGHHGKQACTVGVKHPQLSLLLPRQVVLHFGSVDGLLPLHDVVSTILAPDVAAAAWILAFLYTYVAVMDGCVSFCTAVCVVHANFCYQCNEVLSHGNWLQ